LHRPGPGEWYVTGWELDSAVRNGEVDHVRGFARWFDSSAAAVEHFRVGARLQFTDKYGAKMAAASDAAIADFEKLMRCEPDAPFPRYAQHFFELKRKTPKSHPNYTFYKVCLLNSLYGKLYQRIPTRTQRIIYWAAANALELSGGESNAGGMFHPFLASLVTGRVRASLHDLGVEYEALHESTDSLHVTGDKLPLIRKAGLMGDDLGQLEMKVEGPCLFLRSKLYVHWDMDGKIKKVALHGFQGGTARLLRMWKLGLYHYEHRHMNKPKETLRTGEQPFDMVTKEKFLDVDWPEFQDTVKIGGKTIRLEMPEPKALRT
jgi:hypothetical protein